MKQFCSLSYDALISRSEELFTNVCLLLRLWKLSVVKAPCFALPLSWYSADFFLFFWCSASPRISQASLGSAINCFLWDMIRAPLPSVESHLMEGVVTLRPISSHERLTALSLPSPHPPGVSLFLDLPFYHANPRRTPLRLDQTGPARLPWFSINFCKGASHWCLARLSVFKTQNRWRERMLNP